MSAGDSSIPSLTDILTVFQHCALSSLVASHPSSRALFCSTATSNYGTEKQPAWERKETIVLQASQRAMFKLNE
ncbi:hypothetical protein ST47_g3749 [Ascochyta rabiei]|uniref:Uncharacterized protein n=1 Tax=Didymella rabiei TaxID=5454 RepID=A0A163H185_DIDRA|nr:hypothetical protein ST47_g3749 [Ascochyta rabiei]